MTCRYKTAIDENKFIINEILRVASESSFVLSSYWLEISEVDKPNLIKDYDEALGIITEIYFRTSFIKHSFESFIESYPHYYNGCNAHFVNHIREQINDLMVEMNNDFLEAAEHFITQAQPYTCI